MGSIEILVFGGLMLLSLAFLELGRLLGKSAAKKRFKEATGTGPVETIVFGLLGLLVAFAFTGAESRFEYRRQLITQAASAISTAYSRVDLLDAASLAPMHILLKEYARIRGLIYQNDSDVERQRQLTKENELLQMKIWRLALHGCQQSSIQDCHALVLPAISDMFSVAKLRQSAQHSHPPLVIYAFLIVLTLFGALLTGYNLPAAAKRRNLLYMFTYALVISILITLIIDLESPRSGFIRVDKSDQIILDLSEQM